MRYKLSLLLTEQPEGGFTITCRELPELITECDSLDEMMDNVIDAFHAVAGLYEHEQRPLPADIQIFDDGSDEDVKDKHLLETVVSFNEVEQETNSLFYIRGNRKPTAYSTQDCPNYSII